MQCSRVHILLCVNRAAHRKRCAAKTHKTKANVMKLHFWTLFVSRVVLWFCSLPFSSLSPKSKPLIYYTRPISKEELWRWCKGLGLMDMRKASVEYQEWARTCVSTRSESEGIVPSIIWNSCFLPNTFKFELCSSITPGIAGLSLSYALQITTQVPRPYQYFRCSDSNSDCHPILLKLCYALILWVFSSTMVCAL